MKDGDALPMGLSVTEAQEWVEGDGLQTLISAALGARESIGRCVTVDANVLLVIAALAAAQQDWERVDEVPA